MPAISGKSRYKQDGQADQPRTQPKGESFGKRYVLPLSYLEITGPPSSTGIVPLLFHTRPSSPLPLMGVIDRA